MRMPIVWVGLLLVLALPGVVVPQAVEVAERPINFAEKPVPLVPVRATKAPAATQKRPAGVTALGSVGRQALFAKHATAKGKTAGGKKPIVLHPKPVCARPVAPTKTIKAVAPKPVSKAKPAPKPAPKPASKAKPRPGG